MGQYCVEKCSSISPPSRSAWSPPIKKGRENYVAWKVGVRAYLEDQDLWESVSDESDDKKKDTKARSKIILLIDPMLYIHVRKTKTAKEAWENLAKAFEGTGLTRKGAGLPDQYKPMIMGIESSGIKVTADAIKTKSLQDIRVGKSKKGSAMFGYGNKNSSDSGTNRSRERKYVIADSSSYTRNGSKGTGKGPRCHKCNRYAGHIAKNCDKNSSKKQLMSNQLEMIGFSIPDVPLSEEKSSKLTITTANDQQMETNCVGDIQLPIVQKGNKVNFKSEGAQIINAQGNIIATATLQNNLFKIDRPSENAMLTRSDMLGNALLWHKRMGHVNFPNFNKLKNGLVHGMKVHEKIPEGFVCEICATISRDVIFSEYEKGNSLLNKSSVESRMFFFPEPDHESDSGPPIEDFSYEESDDSSREEPPIGEDQSAPDFILSRQTTSLPEQHLRRGN
ncbi:hypothetical protein JTB14_013887 [Gonioctena quinquepunctata]|nr:hypothetical protein JTB14_013887 [Gonioctena quinquepunctata]